MIKNTKKNEFKVVPKMDSQSNVFLGIIGEI
jgi:hypothetical protein